MSLPDTSSLTAKILKPSGSSKCGVTCSALQESIHNAVAAMRAVDPNRTTEFERLQAELEQLSIANSTIKAKADTDVTLLKAEIETLKVELARMKKSQRPTSKDNAIAVSDGRGSASPDVYQGMIQTNWHGRLGRTRMADVDGMSDAVKEHLDSYLYRTIKQIFPSGQLHTQFDSTSIFAVLVCFGLRLENRSNYIDTISHGELEDLGSSTLSRVRSYIAYCYCFQTHWVWYWNGFVLETLIELARYRGLFSSNGMLKERV